MAGRRRDDGAALSGGRGENRPVITVGARSALLVIQSVLITPNFRGADGISALSRQIARALPQPVTVLSLHDSGDADSGAAIVRGASGGRSRLIALAARSSAECTRDTVIVCTHVHLAPVARLLTWRGASVAYVLCGVEAWVPLRPHPRLFPDRVARPA